MFNSNPLFTHIVVTNQLLSSAPMIIIDVGASGGAPSIWQIFGDQHRIIGFEPNPAEFAKLKSTSTTRYFNIGLGKSRNIRTINVTRWPYAAGMLVPIQAYWNRFPNGPGMQVIGEEQMEVIDLDSFCRENDINTVDFIKLDTEGTELEILEGAEQILADVLAIQVEVTFNETHHGRPVFSDVAHFLNQKGFTLYELNLVRHSRSALPPLEHNIMSPCPYGQVIGGDAVFIRDLIATDIPLVRNPFKVLKQVCLFNLYNQHDSAIELFEWALNDGILPEHYRKIVDFLVPLTLGRQLSLVEYRQIFAMLPQPI